MLPPFIIDQIRRREEQERRHEAPSVELPLPSPMAPGRREQRPRDDEPQRGIVVIDLG
jgi:hypothetical protein